MTDAVPLLVTLRMDAEAFALFNGLRRRHFPPERNHIPAHITLFHALPGREEATVRHVLADATQAIAPFAMATSGLMFLGQGVAFTLAAPQAVALRAGLAARFAPWLTPQDARRGFKPHITVQNKVAPETARALHTELTASFAPQVVTAEGLDLWHYRGGPWEHAAHFAFAA